MGNLFGGSTKNTQTATTSSGPSKFQQPYLQGAFDAAQTTFKNQQGTPFYQGDLYAGMSGDAKASLDKLKEFASGTGLNTANQLSSIGSDLTGYAGKAGTAVDDLVAAGSADNTAAITSAAGKYAANPYVDAMIDANSRDVVRNLNEGTLPAINRAASGTGNINSSRTGVAEGIARRGAEDRVADISSTIRGQAYDRGLTLASADQDRRLGALSTAANAYGSLAQTGIGALTAGANAGYGAFDRINDANAIEQQDRQGQLDADFKSWVGNDTRASDLLQRYFQIVGGNQWGSEGTSTGTTETSQKQGLLSGIIGTAATGLGIAGGLGFKPFK
jgi:hypothetical protein